MKGIPVLMYHALEDEDHSAGAKDPGEQLYVLQVRQFREQMEYLHREGFRTFLLEELFAMDVWPEKSVVLTFDDGHMSNYTMALPILREFGFKAEFFITTGWIGSPHYMNQEQIRGLHKVGMGIGSHGVTHNFFNAMSKPDIETELRVSMNTLNAILDGKVSSFSAPGGRLTDSTVNLASNLNYRFVCSSEPFFYEKTDDSVPRIAITCKMGSTFFGTLVKGNRYLLSLQATKYHLFCMAKRVFGNTGYENFRSKFTKVLVRL